MQQPASNALGEVQTFLKKNPWEIITIIIEDHVETPMVLTSLFNATGLKEFWFPITEMPKNGSDWPILQDMVKKNQRLLVFTSRPEKEASEGIAYLWNYMVENQCKSYHSSTKLSFFLAGRNHWTACT